LELFSKTNEEMQLLHKAVLISFKKKQSSTQGVMLMIKQ